MTGIERKDRVEIGEIVTRAGSDRQRVIDVNDCGDMIEVEVIVEDVDGIYGVGEIEWNSTARYSKVGKA